MENPTYLGDGVYAFWDGYQICLSLGSHLHNPVIYLEPEVYHKLVKFIESLKQQTNQPKPPC